MYIAQLSTELSDLRGLAEDRLKEIEQLSQQIMSLKQDLEAAEHKGGVAGGVATLSEEQVKGSAVYQSLLTQFSILHQGQSCDTCDTAWILHAHNIHV